MLTVVYGKAGGEVSTYCGEIEKAKSTDDFIILQVVSKNGVYLAVKDGKPNYRSFTRNQIHSIRNAAGQIVSPDASIE